MMTGAMRRIGPESTRRAQSKVEVGSITMVGYIKCSADREAASQRDGRGTLS